MSASGHAYGHNRSEREREREFLTVRFSGLINALGAFLNVFTACLGLMLIPAHAHTDLPKPLTVTKHIIRSICENTFSGTAHHYCIRKKLSGMRNH